MLGADPGFGREVTGLEPERVRALMQRMGVTRLADVTGLDRLGIPVFVAVRPNSRSVATSQGKGLSTAAARLGALMEAAETWHAERVAAPLRLAAANELDGPVIEVDLLPRGRDAPLDRDRPILWLAGRRLRTGAPAWVPFELVHTDYRLPAPPAADCFQLTSSGLAAAPSRDVAVRHAVCELIERDALTLWSQRAPRERLGHLVHPEALGSAELVALRHALTAAGFSIGLADITSDLGLPCALAVLADRCEPDGHPGLGTACDPDPARAALRALLEAAQVRTSYIAGSRDDLAPDEYGIAGLRAKRDFVAPLLTKATPSRAWPSGTPELGAEPGEQIAAVGERLARAGLAEPVLVDLGRPETGLAVVRVLAPGLEGNSDDPAYRPGARALAVRGQG